MNTSLCRRKNCWGSWTAAVIALLLVVILPLGGACLAGEDPGTYLHFPPIPAGLGERSLAPWAFFSLAALELGLAGGLVWLLSPVAGKQLRQVAQPFPRWGWAAVVWVMLAWILLWTDQPWSTPVLAQKFTFMWLGYIVALNAACQWRSGTCLLLDQPAFLARLFALSALFWWIFEYLNLYVRNWFYPGMEGLDPWVYFVQASVPFSTVLPAVVSTARLLKSLPPFLTEPVGRSGEPLPGGKKAAIGGLAFSVLGLIGIGLFPRWLFSLIWIAPFILLISLQGLVGQDTCLRAAGYKRPLRYALAALICGGFWELWNFRSFPKWVYAIPHVHGDQVFEMPILGYFGYLPFGMVCLAAADLARKSRLPREAAAAS